MWMEAQGSVMAQPGPRGEGHIPPCLFSWGRGGGFLFSLPRGRVSSRRCGGLQACTHLPAWPVLGQSWVAGWKGTPKAVLTPFEVLLLVVLTGSEDFLSFPASSAMR